MIEIKFVSNYVEFIPMYYSKKKAMFEFPAGTIKKYSDDDETCKWLLESGMAIKLRDIPDIPGRSLVNPIDIKKMAEKFRGVDLKMYNNGEEQKMKEEDKQMNKEWKEFKGNIGKKVKSKKIKQ